MMFMSTIQRPQGIIACLEQALICCSMLHRRRCLVDGRPIRYFFESFILELSRFTSLQTLEIMTFMSTIHDHKASYHVLSKHVLVPMLHHCRSLVDGRPFRFFLTTSYLNSAVSRPYRRSKSWGSCQRFTTTRHHIMSRASMICCSCYIAVVISSMADPSDISWKLYTTPMTFHIL